MSKKKKVTLSYPYVEVSAGGRTRKHDADDTVSLDRAEANRLLHAGLARASAEDDEPSAPETPEV